MTRRDLIKQALAHKNEGRMPFENLIALIDTAKEYAE